MDTQKCYLLYLNLRRHWYIWKTVGCFVRWNDPQKGDNSFPITQKNNDNINICQIHKILIGQSADKSYDTNHKCGFRWGLTDKKLFTILDERERLANFLSPCLSQVEKDRWQQKDSAYTMQGRVTYQPLSCQEDQTSSVMKQTGLSLEGQLDWAKLGATQTQAPSAILLPRRSVNLNGQPLISQDIFLRIVGDPPSLLHPIGKG